MPKLSPFNQVYEIVQQIPKGSVSTYGQISRLMGGRISAAAVGWAMNALGNTRAASDKYNSKTVPWHRVVNSRGGISTRHEAHFDTEGNTLSLQQIMLEQEGIEFKSDQTLDLSKYLWQPNEGRQKKA